MREITFKIEEKQDGLMIRDFLRNFGVSSALLTKLKQDENGISLNGEFAKAIAVLQTSDVLKIRIKNRRRTIEAPTKPCSSPTVQKIKSVSCSGTYFSFV